MENLKIRKLTKNDIDIWNGVALTGTRNLLRSTKKWVQKSKKAERTLKRKFNTKKHSKLSVFLYRLKLLHKELFFVCIFF